MYPIINDIKWFFFKGLDHLINKILHDPAIFIIFSIIVVLTLSILINIVKEDK